MMDFLHSTEFFAVHYFGTESESKRCYFELGLEGMGLHGEEMFFGDEWVEKMMY